MFLPLVLWEENNCACCLVTRSQLGWEQLCSLGRRGLVGCWVLETGAWIPLETRGEGGVWRRPGRLQKAASPQKVNVPTPVSFPQCAGKCLGIFCFFVPDPQGTLETLTEGEAPRLEIALFLQPKPEILVTETCQPVETGLDHLPCQLLGFHSVCAGLLERHKGL